MSSETGEKICLNSIELCPAVTATAKIVPALDGQIELEPVLSGTPTLNRYLEAAE